MTINAGVGMSRHHNPNVAGREAAEQALKKAGVARQSSSSCSAQSARSALPGADGPGGYGRCTPYWLLG